MTRETSVAVLGAGLGGLCAGAKLLEAGFDDVVLFEKADSVGGTWRDNTYPGCCCDVPVSLYQFSFAPSLAWSHVFPRHDEIRRYAEDVADRFGLRPRLRLGEEVTRATWDEGRARWRLETGRGGVHEVEVLVAALGQLNRPQFPDLPGRTDFAGPSFHSARWDHSVDLAGKRVAVVGSAASAVQIVPEVAKVASRLHVFQRTPNWVIPRLDRPITDEEKTLALTAPHVAMMGRELVYQNADHLFWQAFSWTPEGRAAYTKVATNHLEEQVADPALRAKLLPDYPIGCKRILISDDWFPSLSRPNVELVTDRIARVVPTGIETVDGTLREVDAIAWATGFETTGWQWSVDVVGRDGLRLRDAWAESPRAYLGITVARFPNLFVLYGPNTNLGHNSITFMLERQVEYAVKALAAMRERGLAAIEPTDAAQDRFNADLQEALAKTTWADPGCRSWYKNARGEITQNWGSHTRDYADATREVRWEDYAVR
ncbi:MAG: flavin-containing monooxygenase [Alphaproteobacteria bacterium]